MASTFSIYVHVPYCSVKCPYCDFNTYAVNTIPEKEYVDALFKELRYYLNQDRWKGHTLTSIYFGGGTPSLFKASSFERLISYATTKSRTDNLLEVTVEVNPGEVTFEQLKDLRSIGVNRLSIGAQSLMANNLKFLGRKHSPWDIYQTLENARSVGFTNCNLDLMYGLPNQDLESLVKDVDRYLALVPEHVSAYTLTIEEGTPFYQRYKKGLLVKPSDDLVADMMQYLCERLASAGLRWYEVSNFGKPGLESKHNMAYWRYSNYLGLGAGAHSFLRTGAKHCRWANVAKPASYMELVESGRSAQAWLERLSEQEAIFEFFFLGLRTVEGVSLNDFKELFARDAREIYYTLLLVLEEEGFITLEKDILKLTERGLLVADSVIGNFAEPEGPFSGSDLKEHPSKLVQSNSSQGDTSEINSSL